MDFVYNLLLFPTMKHCENRLVFDKVNVISFCICHTFYKPDRFWQNLVCIILSKFGVQKCKRFPPHLNNYYVVNECVAL